LPYGLLLRSKGKIVIYDVHEDVPEDILGKYWIPLLVRNLVSSSFKIFENWAARRMSYVITATPHIARRFIKEQCRVETINNYPIINELLLPKLSEFKKKQAVCYVGVIDDKRGIFQMIEAIERTQGNLIIAGEFSPVHHRDKAVRMSGWNKVNELGSVSRIKVAQVLAESIAGLVLFHPDPNHNNAQPNKMFEYMSAGIPVIASNFPLWRDVVIGNNCGLCVDPLDPIEIAHAIQWMLDHPEEATRMGENGRKAILEKYNWGMESSKLLGVYSELLK